MKKVYQIIMEDEYNNLFLLGFYRQLKDAVADINSWLSTYENVPPLTELKEYVSTFDTCFDVEIYDNEGESTGVMVRGFILGLHDDENINPEATGKPEIGDTIYINYMDGESAYVGKTGIIELIDDAGQIHGTWGGCAVIPNVDEYTIIKKVTK